MVFAAMLADDDDHGNGELSLDLCLGEPPIKPKVVSQFKLSGEHDKDLRTHAHGLADGCTQTTVFEDGREMIKIGDNSIGSQIKLVANKHPTEIYQTSCSAVCMREMDDQSESPQVFSNMFGKMELRPVAGLYVPQDSSASALRKSFSDAAGHLPDAHADAQRRKDVIHQHQLLDQRRKRELLAQKRQAARKKRKMLIIGKQKHRKLQLEENKPFPCSPTHTQKSVEHQRERASEGLLERTSSETSLVSQRDRVHHKQSILQEEGARSQDIRRAVQIERGRAVTDKELMFGSKPKAGDVHNLKIENSSDHIYTQFTAEHNKLETAQWIQKFHELRKLMSPNASSITQKKVPASELASNYSSLDASQGDFRNADQVDILIKKEEILVDKTKKAMSANDKGLETEDPKLLNDQISARKESTDSATTCLTAEPPASPSLSRRLPTNANFFLQTPVVFPLQNVGGFSYPVPYLMLASVSPFTSYPISIPPGSTPFRRATLQSTVNSRTPVLQPTPLRYSRISTTKLRNSFGRSQKQEPKCSQGGATVLPHEISNITRSVAPKPPLSGAFSSEYSKGRSFLDHAYSRTFSGPSSRIQEVAASGLSHSRKSSSSSCEAYQSAHGETVESSPTRNAAAMNVEAIQEHAKQTVSDDCMTRETATHRALPRPWVSTSANGKSIRGVLHIYNKGEVRIRCECHGDYMNAREFIVHAGGVAGPHPERSISVIDPFLFSNSTPAVQC